MQTRPGRCFAGAAALAALVAASASVAAGPAFDLELYAQLLERHTRTTNDVAGTRVDYAAIAASPDWQRLVTSLAAAETDGLAGRAERLAFWVNAYNVLAIDLVARSWPVESIRDIGSLLRPVWKREAGRVGGRPVSLDEVEHQILRPMGEPRIHAAIVCASTSCPSLLREPFRAERIDAQLDEATATFLADPRKGLRVEGDRVRLSRIFSWFRGDFEASGGVLTFARRHLGPEARAALDRLGPDPTVAFFDYDWSLNAVHRGRE